MKGRPADRGNNVRTSKTNIDRARQNIEFSNELIAETSDKELRSELNEKNRKREEAIDDLQREVKKEAKHHKP